MLLLTGGVFWVDGAAIVIFEMDPYPTSEAIIPSILLSGIDFILKNSQKK